MAFRSDRLVAVLAVLLMVNSLPAAMTVPVGGAGQGGTSAATAGGSASQRAIGTVTPLLSPTDESLYAVDWDPSTGNALIGGSNGTVLEYNSTTGFRAMQQDQNFTFRHIAFRPLNTSTLALLAGTDLSNAPAESSVLVLYDGSGFSRIPTAAYKDIAGVAWSPDASYALVAAKKGLDGVVLRYQGGSLSEVHTDTVRNYKALCWGEQGAWLAGYDFDNSSLDIQLFDGATVVADVPVPAQDVFATDLSWSRTLGAGLCTAEMTTVLRFNAASAVKVASAALKGELQGVAWAPERSLALVAGIDLSAEPGTDGLLFSYDGSAVTVESSGLYSGLNDASWNTGGRYALVTGDNGTVLRFNTPNAKPLCLIENPKGGALVGAQTRVNGTAGDPDGDPIVSVQVKVDSGEWQDATGGESWYFDWDTTTAANGQHTLYARSSDGADYSPSDARVVIVDNPNHPPSVTITSPSEGAGVSGTVLVSGTASDPDAGDAVTSVQVSIDGGQWDPCSGTTSWSFGWNTLATDDGPHTISARSSDGEENSTVVSRGVTVQNHGPNAPPTCAITSPGNGATVSGLVLVQGTAADADNGVLAVYVRIDSGAWQQASGNTSWSYNWNSAPETGGGHLLAARAYDGIVNSSEVHINVDVNHPPACTITFPGESSTLSGVVVIKGAANDPDAGQDVTAVFVRIDSGEWVRANGTADWSYRWDTNGTTDGAHTIRARSYDGTDYSAEQSRTVTVDRPPAAVTLSVPASWGIDWVLLVWSRNLDPDFARYEVYASQTEGRPLSELSARIIYGQSVNLYNYTGLSARITYWFRVRVVDNGGREAVSNEVYATTERENTPPVAMLTASRTRATVGETISFSADGSYDPDRGGRIVRYEWDFEGRGRFDIDSGLLSTQRHEFGRASRYQVSVRITDERGATSTATVNVTIAQETASGPDTGMLLAFALVMVIAAAAAGGYFYFRRRPSEVQTYYEEEVHRPAVKRRKEYWPEDEEAPVKKRKR
jgi:hypothetical protein